MAGPAQAINSAVLPDSSLSHSLCRHPSASHVSSISKMLPASHHFSPHCQRPPPTSIITLEFPLANLALALLQSAQHSSQSDFVEVLVLFPVLFQVRANSSPSPAPKTLQLTSCLSPFDRTLNSLHISHQAVFTCGHER